MPSRDTLSADALHFYRLVVIAAALLVSVTTAWSALNYNGYCFSSGQFMSDEEAINRTLSYMLVRSPLSVGPFSSEPAIAKQQLADRVAQFRASQTGCCSIGGIGGDSFPPPTFCNRAQGKVAAVVAVRVPSGVDQIRLHQYAVTNCGHVWAH